MPSRIAPAKRPSKARRAPEGQIVPRLARRAGRQRGARRIGQGHRAGDAPDIHRPRRRRHRHRRPGAQAVHHPQAPGHAIQALNLKHGKEFYVPSFSARTINKGLLLATRSATISTICATARRLGAGAGAQRFSTNTFPTWDLAHRSALIAHNGEINTRAATSTGFGRANHFFASAAGDDPELAADLRRPVRLGLLRQRPGTAGDGRLPPWPTR